MIPEEIEDLILALLAELNPVGRTDHFELIIRALTLLKWPLADIKAYLKGDIL